MDKQTNRQTDRKRQTWRQRDKKGKEIEKRRTVEETSRLRDGETRERQAESK